MTDHVYISVHGKKVFFLIFIHICVNRMSFKNIFKFEFENLLFIYMYLINSNIFVVSTDEHFWENIYLFGKYLLIGKYLFIHSGLSLISKFGEFISPPKWLLSA